MTDLPPSRASDPDTGSEDGPAPDHALSLTVDTHPGGVFTQPHMRLGGGSQRATAISTGSLDDEEEDR